MQPRSLTAPLTGLKYLDVYAELVTTNFFPRPGGAAEIAGQDDMFLTLRAFRELPLWSVNVLIHNRAPQMKFTELLVDVMATQEEIEACEVRLKLMIMPGSGADGGKKTEDDCG
ncbi:hypothetical protein LTR08_006389 [Meristemomyces frigidus]|nr:hypothetical protein LTR08_006389 [Meristemomyces frigidus]